MNKHVSAGDVLFLVGASAVLVLLWWLYSPPVGFVVCSAALGAVIPIVIRILRAWTIKSAFASVLVVLLIVLGFLREHYLSPAARLSLAFIAVFGSAFTVGLFVAEFSLRAFFPIKRVEKQT